MAVCFCRSSTLDKVHVEVCLVYYSKTLVQALKYWQNILIERKQGIEKCLTTINLIQSLVGFHLHSKEATIKVHKACHLRTGVSLKQK